MEHTKVTPYKTGESKKKQVSEMFDNISHSYDFLNHFFSFGIDILWRKKAIGLLKRESPKTILDIATGTGDFAFEALKLNPDKVIGVDISEGMLDIGRKKVVEKGKTDKIELKYGDSENLPFESGSFDAVIVSFGVRNFEDLQIGLNEIQRVLKPGGTAVILEFSKPRKFPIRQVYQFYSSRVMPTLGKWISKDKSAYEYLPESVRAFPDGLQFTALLDKAGFSKNEIHPVTGGIATIYKAKK